jgi:type I restriction enzyme S subunit
LPFDVPESWAWVRLGDVCDFSNGIAKRNGDTGISTPVLRLADLDEDDISFISTRSINLTENEVARYKLQQGDLLFVRVNGSKPNVGKTYAYRSALTVAFCDHLIRGRVSEVADCDYIRFAVRSTMCRTAIDDMIVTTAGQNTISQISLNSVEMSLPPLAEQRRIVVGIESAFAVIDEIEQNKTDLQSAAVSAKSKILSLAVSGKLVPQDPADEPASVLLERIKTERARPVKAGKIKPDKRGKDTAATRYNSHYADLPVGWVTSPVERLFNVVGGGTPSTLKAGYWGSGTPWFSSADIDGNGKITPRRLVTKSGLENSTTNVVKKDSVIVVTRVGLGKVTVLDCDMCFSQDSQALIPYCRETLYSKYAYYFFFNEMQSLKHAGRGTTISGITKKQLENISFSIPPFTEQKRIADTIARLYQILDEIASNME